LLSSVSYASFANYSPRGISELSKRSKRVCSAVKNGNQKSIQSAFKHFNDEVKTLLYPFLNDQVTLIPIPRSSPIVEGALWPSKVIADELVNYNYGMRVSTCLKRSRAVPKSSSLYNAASRPSVQVHLDSLEVEPEIITTSQITLVDDVLTLGRTSFAGAQIIHEVYPDIEIRIFSLFRTKGFVREIDKLIDPYVGEISYNSISGKTTRSD